MYMHTAYSTVGMLYPIKIMYLMLRHSAIVLGGSKILKIMNDASSLINDFI